MKKPLAWYNVSSRCAWMAMARCRSQESSALTVCLVSCGLCRIRDTSSAIPFPPIPANGRRKLSRKSLRVGITLATRSISRPSPNPTRIKRSKVNPVENQRVFEGTHKPVIQQDVGQGCRNCANTSADPAKPESPAYSQGWCTAPIAVKSSTTAQRITLHRIRTSSFARTTRATPERVPRITSASLSSKSWFTNTCGRCLRLPGASRMTLFRRSATNPHGAGKRAPGRAQRPHCRAKTNRAARRTVPKAL